MPKKDDSDSQFTRVDALRPQKFVSGFWELNLTTNGFDCGSWLAFGPKEMAEPTEKVAADVAAILEICEHRESSRHLRYMKYKLVDLPK